MSLKVAIIPDETDCDTVPVEKEEESLDEGTFDPVAEGPDEGHSFLILLRGEPMEEKPEEIEESADDSDESFRKMFEEGRSKVISKCNGE